VAELLPDDNTLIALDIGATKLAAGVVLSDGRVVAEVRNPTPNGPDAALRLLVDMGRDMLARARNEGFMPVAVGIACGGPLDMAERLILSPPNLPGWDRVPIGRIVTDALGLPAHLQNDAGAGALATYLWDNPDGHRDVGYMTVSSGIGCGMINDGRLYAGYTGNGTELGHIPLIWQGRRCGCGQAGCAEAYISGTSIGRRFTEARNDGQTYTAEDVARLATQGDTTAAAFWAETMLMLRRLTRAAIDLFDPALLCLGGGVTNAPRALLAPALDDEGSTSMAEDVGRSVTIRLTGFGRHSGVLSAAAIAANALAPQGARKVEAGT